MNPGTIAAQVRRIAIGAVLLCGGCEEQAIGPELIPWLFEYEIEAPTEEPLSLETAFDFVDPDADVAEVQVIHTDPAGKATRLEDCRITSETCTVALPSDATARNFENITAGTMYVEFSPPEPWIGVHVIEAWLVDREGFESNHVTTVVNVIPPPA